MAKVLVTGANGQVGKAMLSYLAETNCSGVFAATRADLDLSFPDQVRKQLETLWHKLGGFELLVNAAAYTQVDRAESEVEIVRAVNALSVGVMAEFCKDHAVTLLHYSTDYVYSGQGVLPYDEETQLSPVNVYGHSKREGEDLIRASGTRYLIFRTSWVFDSDGSNFLNTMIKLAGDRDELRIVNDQVGAPTYAEDLVRYSLYVYCHMRQLAHFESEVFHLCSQGEVSWYGFASEIFSELRKRHVSLKVSSVLPIASSDYMTKAMRPKNSRMSLAKVTQFLGYAPPDWRDALHRCLEKKYAGHRHSS